MKVWIVSKGEHYESSYPIAAYDFPVTEAEFMKLFKINEDDYYIDVDELEIQSAFNI